MADVLRILASPPAPLPAQVIITVPGKIRKLSEVIAGRQIKIMAVQLADPARAHLYQQGFLENRHALVLHNDHRGRVVVKLHGDIYLLGRRETPKIQVREFVPEK